MDCLCRSLLLCYFPSVCNLWSVCRCSLSAVELATSPKNVFYFYSNPSAFRLAQRPRTLPWVSGWSGRDWARVGLGKHGEDKLHVTGSVTGSDPILGAVVSVRLFGERVDHAAAFWHRSRDFSCPKTSWFFDAIVLSCRWFESPLEPREATNRNWLHYFQEKFVFSFPPT